MNALEQFATAKIDTAKLEQIGDQSVDLLLKCLDRLDVKHDITTAQARDLLCFIGFTALNYPSDGALKPLMETLSKVTIDELLRICSTKT